MQLYLITLLSAKNRIYPFTSKLIVPETGNPSTDSDLCVIFSNLLENAVEACMHMTDGKRFIQLNSSLQSQLFTITMDNSFNGTVIKYGDRFRSTKRNDFGIGLASVQAIAHESQGGTEFKTENNVFLSSVYLRLQKS